jgi:glycine cleavage system H protein
MDGYSYINIFDTKGIEYLVIIAFLVLLIPFWLLLNRKTKLGHEIAKAMNHLSVNIKDIPQGFFYSNNHSWTHLEKSGAATVGLCDMLLQITGEVKLNFLKDTGEIINKGDLIAEIDQNGKHLRLYSPISGIIMNTNPLLALNPRILNYDPYGNGWLCKVKPLNWKSETNSYYLAEEATAWLKAELERLRDFLAIRANKYSPETSMVILQDGGEITGSLLSDLPDELWQDFQHEFLDPKENLS